MCYDKSNNFFLGRRAMSLLSNLVLIVSMVLGWFGYSGTADTSALISESEPFSPPAAVSTYLDAFDVFEKPLPLPDRPGRAAGTHFKDMKYEHYYPEAFYDQVEIMYDLADEKDIEAVCAQYDLLYREFCYIDSLYVLAEIRYSADVHSDYWSGESLYSAELWSETGDALSAACRYVLESDIGGKFSDHIGEDVALSLAAYESLGDREAELFTLETELVNEYFALSNNAREEAVYTYDGRDWTWAMLSGIRGDSLYSNDYEGYLEVWYGLDRQANQLLGPLFRELLAIRTETAEIRGYDSYADYAYECTYGRDFTTEDAQALCDAVKPLAQDYYESLYYSDVWYIYNEVSPVMDSDSLLSALGNTLPLFGPELEKSFSALTENHLYLLTDEPSAQSGAYTTELNYYRSPFLYMYMEGDCYDFSTLTHEFGHFCDSFYTPIPNILTSVGSYDLFEIHSTGLEVLYSEYYDLIYDSGADIARFITLGSQMESLIDGCIMDEFQRRIYEDPDMNLKELNRLYADIRREYGADQTTKEEYSWVYVSHNFEAPLYYLSYAVSSLASLQLWDMAQEDMDAAMTSYLSILGQSAYDEGYMQVLENAGLRLFTETGAVEDICEPVLQELEQLENRILS